MSVLLILTDIEFGLARCGRVFQPLVSKMPKLPEDKRGLLESEILASKILSRLMKASLEVHGTLRLDVFPGFADTN